MNKTQLNKHHAGCLQILLAAGAIKGYFDCLEPTKLLVVLLGIIIDESTIEAEPEVNHLISIHPFIPPDLIVVNSHDSETSYHRYLSK
jgi:hypothetical protein